MELMELLVVAGTLFWIKFSKDVEFIERGEDDKNDVPNH